MEMSTQRAVLLIAFIAALSIWLLWKDAPTTAALPSGRQPFGLAATAATAPGRPRVILLMTPPHGGGSPLWYFGTAEMVNPFVRRGCAYWNCVVTSNRSYANEAALIVFSGPAGTEQCCNKTFNGVSCVSHARQRFEFPAHSPTNAFVFYQMEAPVRSRRECLVPLDDVVNYTYSYKSDSDVLKRHGAYYRLPQQHAVPQARDFYYSATRNVLWYVSNCGNTAEAKRRLQYAVELRDHIDVDIFGRCGNASDGCPTRDAQCVEHVRRRYKFYLAFENSHCDDYITEKFYQALRIGNVPVVRGLPRAQYEKLAPPRSFIHADDFGSPRELAAYLRRLAAAPDEYGEYHAWRAQYGVGMHPDDQCKLCELASVRPRKRVRVSDWFDEETNCR